MAARTVDRLLHVGKMRRNETLLQAENLEIVRSQTGDFTRSQGKEVMESFLQAENGGADICALYAHNDDMAVGAIQAIKEAGLKPGSDILVVAIDAVPDYYKAMAEGDAPAVLGGLAASSAPTTTTPTTTPTTFHIQYNFQL